MKWGRQVSMLTEELRRHRTELAVVLFCMAAVAGLILIMPVWTRALVTDIFPAGRLDVLGRHLLWGTAVITLIAALTFARDYLLHGLSCRVATHIRQRMFGRVLMMPLSQLPHQGHGELISRHSNDINVLQNALTSGVVVFLPNAVILICLLAGLLWYSWPLTLLTLLLIAPLAWTVVRFGYTIRRATHRAQSELAGLTGVLEETLAGAREIKSFGREREIHRRFEKLSGISLARLLVQEKIFAMHPPLVLLTSAVGVALLIFIGAWLYGRGSITLDNLIGFVVCLVLISSPLQELSKSVGLMNVLLAVLDRCDTVLAAPCEELSDPQAPELPAIEGHIRFDQLNFTYGPGAFELIDIDLEIEPGETVAVIGPSGAGKSTLLDLISRFLEPASGMIRLDGHNIAHYRLDSLRNQIALVAQEPVLFEGTLLENLQFAKPEAGMDEIHRAARAAHVEEFANQLVQGYETRLSPRGANLSVGQRQRVAIARALLYDPKILILDEPTSALDAASEQVVQQALRNLMCERTTLIAAHRLSTVRQADRIIVLEGGRIVDVDSHEKLLARKGLYYNLYNMQMSESA